MDCNHLVMGGDLNFILGLSKVWGTRFVSNPLSNYFLDALDRCRLIDMRPTKLNPTWRNRQCGEDHITKRLDCFLVSGRLVSSLNHIRHWVSKGGNLDHNPILIELKGAPKNHPVRLNLMLHGLLMLRLEKLLSIIGSLCILTLRGGLLFFFWKT